MSPARQSPTKKEPAKKATTTKSTTKKKATTKKATMTTATTKKAPATTTATATTTTAKPCFGPEARAFIGQLATRQDRDWFATRKDEFKTLLSDPMLALLSSLGPQLLDDFPAVEDAVPKLFRIYRDTRFAKDKRPFKEHVGGELSLGRAGFYVHVSATELFAGVGLWQMEPDVLQRYRRCLVDNDAIGDALLRETLTLEGRGFGLMSMGELARAPAGVSPTHARIHLLKHKGWAMSLPLDGVDIASPSLPTAIAARVVQMRPAVALLEKALAWRA